MALDLFALFMALAGALPHESSLQPRQFPMLGPIMCNCNNPFTKETHVQRLCDKVGGEVKHGIFPGIEQIEQYMCIVNLADEAEEVFTDRACEDLYGDEYNSFCSEYWPSEHWPSTPITTTPPPPSGCKGKQVTCPQTPLNVPLNPVCDGPDLLCIAFVGFVMYPMGRCTKCGGVWIPESDDEFPDFPDFPSTWGK